MLTYQSALDGVKARVATDFPLHAVGEDTTFAGLGMDSLDLISFLKQVEDDFSIRLPEESLGEMDSVGTVARWIVALTP